MRQRKPQAEREIQMLRMLLVAAPLALSTAAVAETSHLTDAQFIAAARCQALMASSVLGPQDTRGVDQLMNRESRWRVPGVMDRADAAREEAGRAARRAGPYNKAQLIAERDGACRAVTGAGTTSASVTPTGAARTN
jgi:hypothetical protein